MTKYEAPWPSSLPEKCVYGVCFLASWSIRIWPRRLQLLFGAYLGEVFCLAAGYRKQVVLNNLQIAYPEMSASERQHFLHQHFRHLGQLALEYVISISIRPSDLKNWFVTGDTSGLDDALAEGKGVILLGAHMGACDLGIVLTAYSGYSMVVVGKKTRVRWITRLLFGMREIHGVGALPEERTTGEIIRALKKNKVAIFVMDQYMGPPQGTASKFFGRETGTARGTAVFADKFKVPVVPVMCVRRDDGKIQLMVSPRLDLTGLTQDEMTQKFNDEIEKMVRVKPEQWFWVHKRWKPFTGERSTSYDIVENLNLSSESTPV